jgi:hypothetical protein
LYRLDDVACTGCYALCSRKIAIPSRRSGPLLRAAARASAEEATQARALARAQAAAPRLRGIGRRAERRLHGSVGQLCARARQSVITLWELLEPFNGRC